MRNSAIPNGPCSTRARARVLLFQLNGAMIFGVPKRQTGNTMPSQTVCVIFDLSEVVHLGLHRCHYAIEKRPSKSN